MVVLPRTFRILIWTVILLFDEGQAENQTTSAITTVTHIIADTGGASVTSKRGLTTTANIPTTVTSINISGISSDSLSTTNSVDTSNAGVSPSTSLSTKAINTSGSVTVVTEANTTTSNAIISTEANTTTSNATVGTGANTTTSNATVGTGTNSTTSNAIVIAEANTTTSNATVGAGVDTTTSNAIISADANTTTSNAMVGAGTNTTTSNATVACANGNLTTMVTSQPEGGNVTSNSAVTTRISNNESSTAETNTTTVTPYPAEDICNTLNPCRNQGGCSSVNATHYTCVCNTHWTGVNCTEDVDECAGTSHQCDTSKSVCVNEDGGYSCNCTTGFIHDRANIKKCIDLDECRTNQHDCSGLGTVCKNTIGSYECNCKSGYYMNSTSSQCNKLELSKVEFKAWDSVWDSKFSDKSSSEYKDMVKRIEENVTITLNASMPDQTYKVKVTNLAKGSVLVTMVVQAVPGTAVENLLPTSKKIELDESDLCTFNYCDSRTTRCVAFKEIRGYQCQCKEHYMAIPGVVNMCKYKDQCTIGDLPCPAHGQCELELGVYKCVVNACYEEPSLCEHDGECKPLAHGGHVCSCTEGFSGRKCETKTIPLSERVGLERILIGVGVGLGTLAFFLSIGLIIVCCSESSKANRSKAYSPGKKLINSYAADDVTIDSWEPSLPRLKVKEGAFGRRGEDIIEMDEKRASTEDARDQRKGAAIENPAFIPEADYESHSRGGRLVSTDKKGTGDYMYF